MITESYLTDNEFIGLREMVSRRPFLRKQWAAWMKDRRL